MQNIFVRKLFYIICIVYCSFYYTAYPLFTVPPVTGKASQAV